MKAPRFVLWSARIALVALPVTMGFIGCSRQSEGDRCDKAAAGDTDCNDGLICVRCVDLASGSTDKCCPPNAGDASDPDCRRADPPRTNDPQCSTPTGGTGGLGFGGRGNAGSGPAGSGGVSAGSGGVSAGSGGSSNGEAGASDSGTGGV